MTLTQGTIMIPTFSNLLSSVLIPIFIFLFLGKTFSYNHFPAKDNCEYLKKHNWIGEKRGSSLTIELDAIAIADYEILVDGKPYDGIFRPYQKKKVHFYNLSELRNHVFYVHEFMVGSREFKGKFDNAMEWVGYLNIYSSVEWFWDGVRGLLYNKDDSHQVGNMLVSKMDDGGNLLEFPVSSIEISKNVIIEIPEGKHKVTIHNFVMGCSETVEVEV